MGITTSPTKMAGAAGSRSNVTLAFDRPGGGTLGQMRRQLIAYLGTAGAVQQAEISGQSADDAVRIPRRPAESAARRYDLVVIGGGIYGIALTFEAARRGYRAVLLERGDFGGGTSWSSLRIIHGGLRYLQMMDLRRFRESVAERRWFLRHFPDLVRPLPCLMPLYGHGLKRPGFLRLALAGNDLLALDRNRDLDPRVRLPRGRVLSAHETSQLFPQARRHGLRGGALWYDAVMLSSERVLMDLLSWACRCGATALNYIEVERIVIEDGRSAGVEARDRVTDSLHRFQAPRVVNATGPRVRLLARQSDRDLPTLFRPTLAFNLLVDRPPLAEVAVAVQPPQRGAQVYFLLPWKGRVLAGTCYAGLPDDTLEPKVAESQVKLFLDELNAAVPGLDLAPGEVIHIYAGLLPGGQAGTAELATHAVVHDHGRHGGPQGLYSISGVKFTTARGVAEDTLRAIFGRQLRPASSAPARPRPLMDFAGQTLLSAGTPCGSEASEREALARRIIREEAVVRPEDLLLRRLDSAEALAERARAAEALRGVLESALPEAPPPVSD
jgi:glycerol-3-phosphate dehydrogenase